jgi:hypothetical protein
MIVICYAKQATFLPEKSIAGKGAIPAVLSDPPVVAPSIYFVLQFVQIAHIAKNAVSWAKNRHCNACSAQYWSNFVRVSDRILCVTLLSEQVTLRVFAVIRMCHLWYLFGLVLWWLQPRVV